MYIWPKLHFPENLFSKIYACQNKRLAEIAFPRKLIFQNLHFARMYIWPKLNFPENLFSRIYTCQNVHLAEIEFPRKLIFQNFF